MTDDMTATERAASSGGVADAPEAQTSELSRLGLMLRVVPIFDLRRRLASTMFCVLTKQDVGGALRLGDGLLVGLGENRTAAVDMERLRVAKRYAERYARSSATAAVGVGVSLTTLLNPRFRKDYIAELRATNLPPTNPLMIQIDGAARGTPMARLAEAVNRVGPATRYVLLAVAPNFTWGMGALGVSVIGINLTGHEDTDTVQRRAQALMTLCRSQQALGYLNMLPSSGAVAVAAAAGVRFGTGPALCLTTFAPDGPLPKIPVPARTA